MSSKTPYEIRTELLRLAYDICHQKARSEVKTYDTNNNPIFTAPTSEEIIAEATKLNDFVSSVSKPSNVFNSK